MRFAVLPSFFLLSFTTLVICPKTIAPNLNAEEQILESEKQKISVSFAQLDWFIRSVFSFRMGLGSSVFILGSFVLVFRSVHTLNVYLKISFELFFSAVSAVVAITDDDYDEKLKFLSR